MKNFLKYIVLLIISCIGILALLEYIEPKPKMTKNHPMEIICYSCGRGENPENTIEGIRHCQTINPDWRIEMDIQLTSDGQLVLFHDYETKRITGVDKLINELSLKEVNELNAGYNFKIEEAYIYRTAPIKIPTLREVFRAFPKAKLLLDIHTNNPKVVKIFLDLIDLEFKAGDFFIASEYDEIIKQLKKEQPNWTYAVPAKEAKKMLYSSFLYLDGLFPIQSDILMIPMKYGNINVLRNRVINHAKKRNKKIWAWMYEGEEVRTVNSVEEIEALRALGIDGVFTDYPKLIKNKLE